MRTREHDWYDAKEGRPKYGIQVLWRGRWLNVAKDGEPDLYDTPEERDARRAELRKQRVGDLSA